MSREAWIGLKKSQRKYLSQLLEYIESEDIFSKKDSFDILYMEDVPGAEFHDSKMAGRYELRVEGLKKTINRILERGHYTENEKNALTILREHVRKQNYPFQNFVFDPHKKK